MPRLHAAAMPQQFLRLHNLDTPTVVSCKNSPSGRELPSYLAHPAKQFSSVGLLLMVASARDVSICDGSLSHPHSTWLSHDIDAGMRCWHCRHGTAMTPK